MEKHHKGLPVDDEVVGQATKKADPPVKTDVSKATLVNGLLHSLSFTTKDDDHVDEKTDLIPKLPAVAPQMPSGNLPAGMAETLLGLVGSVLSHPQACQLPGGKSQEAFDEKPKADSFLEQVVGAAKTIQEASGDKVGAANHVGLVDALTDMAAKKAAMAVKKDQAEEKAKASSMSLMDQLGGMAMKGGDMLGKAATDALGGTSLLDKIGGAVGAGADALGGAVASGADALGGTSLLDKIGSAVETGVDATVKAAEDLPVPSIAVQTSAKAKPTRWSEIMDQSGLRAQIGSESEA